MFTKKESAGIFVAILTMSFALSIWNLKIFPSIFLSIFLIVLANIIAKKISAYNFEAKIENRIWEVQKYGFKPESRFNKPLFFGMINVRSVWMGIILPVITSIISLGYFTWLGVLVFDVKPKSYRTAKRHGLYSFSEMTENQIGYIAAFGVLANLLLAVVGYLIGFELFAKLNIYCAFFNMIPLSDLDGNKIFYGNIVLWSFLSALTLVGLGWAFFIV